MVVDRLEWLTRKLAEVEGDVDAAREASSFNALGVLYREARTVRNEYDAEVEKRAALTAEVASAPPTQATADEMLSAAMTEAAALPEADRREILADFARALGLAAPALRLLGGGQ
jgi:hypothetical protein